MQSADGSKDWIGVFKMLEAARNSQTKESGDVSSHKNTAQQHAAPDRQNSKVDPRIKAQKQTSNPLRCEDYQNYDSPESSDEQESQPLRADYENYDSPESEAGESEGEQQSSEGSLSASSESVPELEEAESLPDLEEVPRTCSECPGI